MNTNETTWLPEQYHPGLTTEDWLNLLNNNQIFTQSSKEIMKRLKDYGGMATCKQLAEKYGKSANYYNSGSVALAQKIAQETNCNLMSEGETNYRWWPILYTGRKADSREQGSFIWRLRDELSEALDQVDLSDISLYTQAHPHNEEVTPQYWWLNASPKQWSFSSIDVGEVRNYTLYNERGNMRRIHKHFIDARVGDRIICYESQPVKQVVALGEVVREQDGKDIYFEKTEALTVPIDYALLKSSPELAEMEYFRNVQGSLFKLTAEEYEFIMDIIRETNPVTQPAQRNDKYTKENYLEEVYMTEERYEDLVSLLRHKKNIILQGAPGVGKTYTTKRLAYSIMGEKDESRIEFAQFHQNYTYEDFIMGYRPEENGFKLVNGIFYEFCLQAANQPEKDFYFIIDEINRGNMSKIFGELLMLIEKEYRGTKVKLPYSKMKFSIPPNLYLIGMMNTADRSLALIDYALRRRFGFFEMVPGFDSAGFRALQESYDDRVFDRLIRKIRELNREIERDDSLGKGFCIGHSYFCGQIACTERWMREIVCYDIIPMLEEYWFDDKDKLEHWKSSLSGVFDDER